MLNEAPILLLGGEKKFTAEPLMWVPEWFIYSQLDPIGSVIGLQDILFWDPYIKIKLYH